MKESLLSDYYNVCTFNVCVCACARTGDQSNVYSYHWPIECWDGLLNLPANLVRNKWQLPDVGVVFLLLGLFYFVVRYQKLNS